MKNMKKILVLVLVLAMVFSLVACGGKKEDPNANKTYKDHLVVVGKTEPASIDPHNVNMVTAFTIAYQVFDRLFTLDTEGNVHPQLAEKWDWVDETTLRVKIHEGVKFTNGDDLTAEDVLYSLQRGCTSSYSAATLAPFDSANSKVVDKYTIDIKTFNPYPGALNTLTHGRASILSKRAVEELGDNFNRTPVGSGRLKVISWNAGDAIEFERNEDYWNKEEMPTFSKLTMRFISENASRAIEVETGAADLALEVAATDKTRLEDNPNVKVYAVAGATVNQLVLNGVKFDYLSDVRVRKALHLAIDANAIAKTAYVVADVSDSLVPPCSWGYKAIGPEKQNAEEAKKLLAEAGFDMNQELVINVAKGNEVQTAAEMIANMWSAIGLKARVEIIENATLTTNNSKGMTPICITTYTLACGLPESMFLNFEKTTTYAWAAEGEFVDRLKAAKIITDDAARLQAYADLQQEAWDLHTVVPLCVSQKVYATGANVTGLELSPTNQPDFSKLSVLE